MSILSRLPITPAAASTLGTHISAVIYFKSQMTGFSLPDTELAVAGRIVEYMGAAWGVAPGRLSQLKVGLTMDLHHHFTLKLAVEDEEVQGLFDIVNKEIYFLIDTSDDAITD
jgi:hypothetical protein